jgi:8-oxo-dGTP pyrophosphatase MutT (NUDIX family)
VARLKTALAVSAGGVVFRVVDDRIEVALCGRTANGLWGLPKGTPNKGEDLLHTALREVREETGLEVRTHAPIGQIEYWFVARGVRFHKTVHYFLMEAVGGDVSRHDPEYDVVEWFSVGEAYEKMSYKNEAAIVRRAESMIRRRYPDLPAGETQEPEPSTAEVDREGG